MKLCFALENTAFTNMMEKEGATYYLCTQFAINALNRLQATPEYLILDSGAFAVWKSGRTVDLHEYAKVAVDVHKKYSKLGTQIEIANLDILPGQAGRAPTKSEVASAMEGSLKNADVLRGYGLPVMEVYHQGEPLSFLDHLLSRRPDHHAVIGLSPRKDRGHKAQLEFCQDVLAHLINNYGKDNLPRMHGFGVTGPRLLRAFPFYSVGSTSWVKAQKFGQYIEHDGTTKNVLTVLPSTRNRDAVQLLVRRSIQNMIGLGNEITTLWKNRGIIWTD